MASSDIAAVTGLADYKNWMSEDEVRLTQLLLTHDQAHLFAGWQVNDALDKKRKFFDQVRNYTIM